MLNPDATLAELRAPLVDAMLPHANFDGWGTRTLLAAAGDLGLNADTAALVFTGPADMIAAWTALADARMAERLAVEGGADMKIRARVTRAIRIRLEDAAPDREAVARALAVQARPGNLRSAAATAWATADAIWRACGDTSTDFNFYSKRAIVGSVYGATLLYWLRDDSEDLCRDLGLPRPPHRGRDANRKTEGPGARLHRQPARPGAVSGPASLSGELT